MICAWSVENKPELAQLEPDLERGKESDNKGLNSNSWHRTYRLNHQILWRNKKVVLVWEKKADQFCLSKVDLPNTNPGKLRKADQSLNGIQTLLTAEYFEHYRIFSKFINSSLVSKYLAWHDRTIFNYYSNTATMSGSQQPFSQWWHERMESQFSTPSNIYSLCVPEYFFFAMLVYLWTTEQILWKHHENTPI